MATVNPAYQPIDCSFYDRLEAAATLKKVVQLKYWHNEKLIETTAVIETIKLKNKIEWLVLKNDIVIRLDHIYSLDGVVLEKSC